MEFRSARHTNNLNALVMFYTDVLGMDLLFSFENHNDYSGAFIGKKGHDWHLEFTMSNEETTHNFDEDDVWVFYPTEQSEYDSIVKRIETHQIKKIKAKNPFWNENGITVKDPDGFRVIISHMKVR